jgi:hypothetical protein
VSSLSLVNSLLFLYHQALKLEGRREGGKRKEEGEEGGRGERRERVLTILTRQVVISRELFAYVERKSKGKEDEERRGVERWWEKEERISSGRRCRERWSREEARRRKNERTHKLQGIQNTKKNLRNPKT